jgi:hypothetical protein
MKRRRQCLINKLEFKNTDLTEEKKFRRDLPLMARITIIRQM